MNLPKLSDINKVEYSKRIWIKSGTSKCRNHSSCINCLFTTGDKLGFIYINICDRLLLNYINAGLKVLNSNIKLK